MEGKFLIWKIDTKVPKYTARMNRGIFRELVISLQETEGETDIKFKVFCRRIGSGLPGGDEERKETKQHKVGRTGKERIKEESE